MIQRDKLTDKVRVKGSSFVNVGCYTSHLYVPIVVDNDKNGFSFFFFIYICAPLRIYKYIYARVLSLLLVSLSLSFVGSKGLSGSEIHR